MRVGGGNVSWWRGEEERERVGEYGGQRFRVRRRLGIECIESNSKEAEAVGEWSVSSRLSSLWSRVPVSGGQSRGALRKNKAGLANTSK